MGTPGRSRTVRHDERGDFGEAMQVRLCRIGAGLSWRNGIYVADDGEKRRREEHSPRVGGDVVCNGVAEPDEGIRSLLDIGVGKECVFGDARIPEKRLLTGFGRWKGKFFLLASGDKADSS